MPKTIVVFVWIVSNSIWEQPMDNISPRLMAYAHATTPMEYCLAFAHHVITVDKWGGIAYCIEDKWTDEEFAEYHRGGKPFRVCRGDGCRNEFQF
jgi:hypothetical protein